MTKAPEQPDRAILLISCPDQSGITASVTKFIADHGGNILHADQHIDDQEEIFFMRIEWSLEDFKLTRDEITRDFSPFADHFRMDWSLHFSDEHPRMAVFVSRHMHCLYDILYRYKSGQLACTIPLIISNHREAEDIARDHHIDFHHIPITAETKVDQEQREIQILQDAHIDLVVLARYHQILTANFIEHFPNRIINIHHSFLPAFAGGSPYAQAYRKGVKLIGATSHFVTEQLDEGPIIEQNTSRISHRDTLQDLKQKGEDLERIVFSRAIIAALERRILIYGNKTVVF